MVTKNWWTNFFALQIGLFQGCCMSVMIFNVVFQMLLDYHSQFCQRKRIGYAFKNAQITVVNPSFADDITLAASDATDCQQSINTMQEIVTWTKTMAFKPSKCRSWAGRFFRNGEKTKFTKLQNSTYSFYDPLLTVNGDAILCVGQDTKSDFMFKILGRQLQWELTNDKIIEKLDTLIEEWLNKVNTIPLSGCIKSWIVDNVVVSRFSWPLLIYDFPQSVVQNWSNRCIAFYKKWLKMSRCAETSILFRNRQENFGLGFKNLEIENKCFQIVKWHILKNSMDDQMRALYTHKLNQEKAGKLGKGRKADRAPCLAVERLESIAQFNERFGQGQTSRHGIGWNHIKSVPFSKMSNKQQRGKLTEITRQEAEDKRIVLLMKYNMQNGFLNWGKLEMEMECDDLSWKKVLTQYSDRLLSFVLNSQLNTLPTPNNLRLWGSAKNLSCGLCGKSDSVTFGHIMGGCPWVLNVENKTTPSEDRYTWRHNNVLRVLCNAIVRKVQQRNRDSQKDTAPGIHFVKEKATASTISSAKILNKKKTFYGDLATSNDWTVFFELPELKAFSIKHFPQDICQTTKQVDAFVISRSRKICFVGPELTVPIEERIAFWNEKKTGKYEKMIADHGSPSWKLKCIVAEVGCRGYIPPSFRKALQLFGFTSKELKALVDECSLVSRRSSYYIWLNRFHQTFIPFQMVQVDIESYQSIAVV